MIIHLVKKTVIMFLFSAIFQLHLDTCIWWNLASSWRDLYFYGGQPGNRGAAMDVSVKEVRSYVHEAQWCYFKPDGKEALDWTLIDGN